MNVIRNVRPANPCVDARTAIMNPGGGEEQYSFTIAFHAARAIGANPS